MLQGRHTDENGGFGGMSSGPFHRRIHRLAFALYTLLYVQNTSLEVLCEGARYRRHVFHTSGIDHLQIIPTVHDLGLSGQLYS